ncbi:MAG: VIT1/CCC1 transporter family protein [Gemmatimonadales bacterium]
MPTQPSSRPAAQPPGPPADLPSGRPAADVHSWHHHLADESDAAFLYRELAKTEPDLGRASIYQQLAEVEDRHVERWQGLLAQHGHPSERPAPSLRARMMGWLGRRIGPSALLPLLLQEEGREVKGYLRMYREAPEGAAAPTALTLARESKAHADRLAGLVGDGKATGEPWHKTGAGGFLRNVVYGFNDGLTANFGLVAGMVGAQAGLGGGVTHAVIVAGLAGMVADALSMGSSGYLAAKSEREVFEHEIAMEREEIRLMPELEREELSLIYQAKGIPAAQAGELATAVMADPEKALQEKVREELKIGTATSTPLREGWVTGVATAFGAFIPVAPLLVSRSPTAIWISFAIAMLSHFGVGAARSFFTGRGVLRSGLDMFLVGLGVAVVGYFVGEWIVRVL